MGQKKERLLKHRVGKLPKVTALGVDGIFVATFCITLTFISRNILNHPQPDILAEQA